MVNGLYDASKEGLLAYPEEKSKCKLLSPVPQTKLRSV